MKNLAPFFTRYSWLEIEKVLGVWKSYSYSSLSMLFLAGDRKYSVREKTSYISLARDCYPEIKIIGVWKNLTSFVTLFSTGEIKRWIKNLAPFVVSYPSSPQGELIGGIMIYPLTRCSDRWKAPKIYFTRPFPPQAVLVTSGVQALSFI